jgi:hypothetical protein
LRTSRKPGVDGRTLISRLSFTHLAELIAIDDPLKRAFYEVECIRGNWSVRALERQITTLYFERSGLSRDKEKLAALAHAAADRVVGRYSSRHEDVIGKGDRQCKGDALRRPPWTRSLAWINPRA